MSTSFSFGGMSEGMVTQFGGDDTGERRVSLHDILSGTEHSRLIKLRPVALPFAATSGNEKQAQRETKCAPGSSRQIRDTSVLLVWRWPGS